MAARAGMANPILKLRNLAQVGTSDYTISGTAYWDDNQLQTVLDEHRIDIFQVAMRAQATQDGSGTVKYFDYFFDSGDWEEGTPTFICATSLGSAVAPTLNYQSGHASFGTVNQLGTAYYYSGRRFDMFGAAADVWRRKAGNVSAYYTFSADGQTMNRSDLQKNYLEMARYFDSQSAPLTVQVYRGDEP